MSAWCSAVIPRTERGVQTINRRLPTLAAHQEEDDAPISVEDESNLRNTAPTEPRLLGSSAPIRALRAQVARFACADSTPVHVWGESGVGKEVVVRLLHRSSQRRHAPFFAVNCAAIPDTLFEAELFGHRRGAFTGAAQNRKGKFVAADGGTLFLDEVGELSPLAQAKLLRAVESGEVESVGADGATKVNTRIVTATHHDLASAVAEGRFRRDLYYRLNVLQLQVPPLRARRDDIPILARYFISEFGRRLGKTVRDVSETTMQSLTERVWPGNVRELRNEVERAVVLSEDGALDSELLTSASHEVGYPALAGSTADHDLATRYASLKGTERRLIEEALTSSNGNVSAAAKLLGVTRIVVRRRLDRLRLEANSNRTPDALSECGVNALHGVPIR
ncbi:MAG TPA: sigma 54-interacting transcriptional regulator [Polyangia bacterium]|nr:sigma 54-interacting transcriptional regulator [Polyangia bacterium]